MFLILIYCALIALASLAGGGLPALVRLTHLRMQLMMSLVSGLMLGVALLHLLPLAIVYSPSVKQVAVGILGGLLAMFFLLRFFHVHHHGDAEEHHGKQHTGYEHHHHSLSWLGLFLGLAIHTFLDGVAIAASVMAEARHGHAGGWWLIGSSTFLAVLLHKPLDAVSITSLMRASGWTTRHQMVVNCGFALACPLGALLFWFGAAPLAESQNTVVGWALAFSAGFFLCIALGDLLPEVQFHSHDSVKLSIALLLGVALAAAIELLPSHQHQNPNGGGGSLPDFRPSHLRG